MNDEKKKSESFTNLISGSSVLEQGKETMLMIPDATNLTT
jgi:hypothetical protein